MIKKESYSFDGLRKAANKIEKASNKLLHDNFLLLDELKRLVENLESRFTHTIYEDEVYSDIESSRALIKKIEGS